MPYIIKALLTGRNRDASSPSLKKGNLGLAKNYHRITLTSLTVKVHNALLSNRIEPKLENILRKNQNGFRWNRTTMSQILIIHQILEGVCAKNLEAIILFVAAIMMLYKNTKVKICSSDGDTHYFDIVVGILEGDTLAPYLSIISLHYVFRRSIYKIKKKVPC